DRRHFINDTGTGNTLNLSHARVLQMVMDSLRYWAESFHIDGFRFDLCATLGREGYGFDPGAGFFDAIRQDPVLSQLKLIAEPWDPGPGGYNWAIIHRLLRNGMTDIATRCANTGAVMRASAQNWRAGCRDRRIFSSGRRGQAGRRSISLPVM